MGMVEEAPASALSIAYSESDMVDEGFEEKKTKVLVNKIVSSL